ncbi:DUF4129 domain-containing protein [Haloparvum alkalitolerans]|uniref:DUF4129 domain-containing protein n=1 Tax=Haloparvum alkalitolerans TaxID=1042953 RepID=UPI003CE9D4B5
MTRRPFVAIVLGALFIGVVIVGTVPAGAAVDTVADTPLQVVNNSTETPPPHENPEEASGDGDDDQVASYLAAQLASRLGDSTREISQGQYEHGRTLVGDEYDAILDQYVEVAGDTGNEDTAAELNETKAEQERLANQLEEYEETREEYEEAVANGDEERARELARELQVQASEISETTTNLDGQYATFEEDLQTDFTESRQQLAELNATVTNESAAIRDAQLVGTTLNATANTSSGSFTEPVEVTGQLVTTDGDPVANRSIGVVVGQRQYSVDTNESGHFSLVYRPVFLATSATDAPVRFNPRNSSAYLQSETTIPLTVTEQTPSETALTTATETVQFDETVEATGTVSIANRTVAGIPVTLSVDGQPLARGETTADGSYTLTGRLPAAVEAGSQSATVAVGLSEAAVASSNASAERRVGSTTTGLDMNASISENTLSLAGQLTTATGVAPGERQLTVTLEGRHLATITTDTDGTFTHTVTVPETARSAEAIKPVVTFDGSGLNLEGSEASTTVPLASGSTSESGNSASELPTVPVIGLGAVVLLGLLATTWWYVRGGTLQTYVPVLFGTAPKSSTAAADTATADDASTTTPDAATSQAKQLLEHAKAADAAGNTTTAVTASYAAARRALQDRVTDADLEAATPREFAARIQDHLQDSSPLHTLTQAFERATFGETPVDATAAHDAVETAESLVDARQSTPTDGSQTER